MHLSLTTTLHPDLALTALFGLVSVVIGVYAAAVPQGNRRWWALAGLLAALVLIALQFEGVLTRMLLLDAAGLVAVVLVWSQPGRQSKQAARTYLWMMLAAIACTAAGMAAAGVFAGASSTAPAAPLDRVAALLLITGFALKLALVPVYFWLPGIAAASSPMTSALIIATLDMAEFGELLSLRQEAPWVFDNHAGIWLTLALLSMFGGALLALAQHDMKRMLAFSTVDDMGYLLLGVLAGSEIGLTGALFGVVSHALCKVLLFGAVGIAEKGLGEPVDFDCRGLAARFPVSAAMFITGSLGILGIPPLVGFAGRWRLYLTGVQYGGPALGIVMALTTGLALLYYVRAIHRVWLGPAPANSPTTATEPRAAAAVLIVVALVALALGLFPGLLRLVL